MVHTRSSKLIQFADLSGPVRFTDCEALIAPLCSIFRGWDIHEVEGDAQPAMHVTKTPRGFRRVSARLSTPAASRDKIRETVVEAICGFHFELIDWYLEEHPDQLFVHCAAAHFGNGLVVFPAVAKAGKSTLSVYLAMEGVRIFCDDVLPIDTATREGAAFGILPRLRRSGPGAETAELRAFVDARIGPSNDNRIYVDIEELAPFGETAAIQALVLLDRREHGAAVLEETDKADALEQIILQNFARDVPSPRILDTLHAVVDDADCYRLSFADAKAAVDVLMGVFGDAGADRDGPFVRRADAVERRVGDGVFLANPEDGTLYRLNETVAALWHLLSKPTGVAEAVRVFQQAFPDAPADEIADQVETMFFDLYEEGLIEPAK